MKRAVSVAFLLLSTPAAADDHADRATAAEALFDAGRQLAAESRYEEACPKFEASHRLEPAVGTLLNLAECWQKIGKTASSWVAYREAASLAHWQNQPQREAFARARASEIEPRLARLVVRVADDELAVDVKRNGVPLPPSAWDVPTPVDPGEYRIDASAPNRMPFAAMVVVPPEQTVAVEVPTLKPRPGEPVRSATSKTSTSPEKPSAPRRHDSRAPEAPSSVPKTISIALGAAGLAMFGVAGFFGIRTLTEDAEARRICRGSENNCTTTDVRRHQELVDAAYDHRTISYATAGVGSALLLGAVGLFLVTRPPEKAGRRAPAVVAIGVGGRGEASTLSIQGYF